MCRTIMMQEKDKYKLNDPIPVQKVLNAQNTLKSLLNKANTLRTIEQQLQKLLPKEISAHCQVMNLTNNTLVLGVDSAAWATTLRFIEKELLNQLRLLDVLKNLKGIKYRIHSKE